MSYERGPSLHGARLADVDFSGARLHGPDFEDSKITDGYFVNADISGDITGLRLNGVAVAPLVEAELIGRFPERAKLHAGDRDGLAEAWDIIEDRWRATLKRASSLPEPMLHERVDDEWSFLETLRHLVMATDTWLLRMVGHQSRPFHRWGVAGSFLTDPRAIGLDPDADPLLAEVLEVRRGRMDAVRATIDALTPGELERVCIPPDPPGHPREAHTVLHCLHVVLNEEWEHNQYANRDLAVLEAACGELPD
ncbi:MAG: DinB family protein [Acidimicrobiales bacterium]